MNIALAALLITLLLLPAFGFRIAIKQHDKVTPLIAPLTLTDTLWVFSLVPVVIHLFAVLFLKLIGLVIDTQALLGILGLLKMDSIRPIDFTWDLVNFLFYTVATTTAGFLAGKVANWAQDKFRLIESVTSTASKPWYLLLKEPVSSDTEYRFAQVVSNFKEGTLIQSGICNAFYLKPGTAEIEFIEMRAVGAKWLKDSSTDPGTPQDALDKLSGAKVLIPMNSVLRISTYVLNSEEN